MKVKELILTVVLLLTNCGYPDPPSWNSEDSSHTTKCIYFYNDANTQVIWQKYNNELEKLRLENCIKISKICIDACREQKHYCRTLHNISKDVCKKQIVGG